MKKYFVYHGHVDESNYDCSEGSSPYTLDEFGNLEEILELRKYYEDNICNNDTCAHVKFTVFEGNILKLKAKQTITEWEIE